MSTKMKSFREAYQVLQGHAGTLREQTEPNIDDLLTIVKESVDAYKICKERIDAVEKALQQTLTEVPVESGSQSRAVDSNAGQNDWAGAPASQRGSQDLDEEIPF